MEKIFFYNGDSKIYREGENQIPQKNELINKKFPSIV